jgi:hypothetical protein
MKGIPFFVNRYQSMHAHFDCFSGISGDMVIGAFVDMGLPIDWLVKQIRNLPIGDIDIVATDVTKGGVGATKVAVVEKQAATHRTYRDILNLFENGGLGERVTAMAVDIFSRIADAEAHIHRCAKDQVHFHEVGAVDSIVDIAGAAICLEYFNIESVSSSPLPLGRGRVACAHGELPVPAPATLEILKGVPVYGGTADGELVTPTGAGIITTIAQRFGSIPAMKIERVGYGSGSRDNNGLPNLLRVMIGTSNQQEIEPGIGDVCIVATNIDDMNPELFGYLMEKLFLKGALDVCLVPVTMKKNRPGTKVEVLCDPDKKNTIVATLLSETTTIGVRYHWAHRHILKRSFSTVTTRFGAVQVKCTTDLEGNRHCAPEYELCRRIAIEHQVPLKVVYDAVVNSIHDMPDSQKERF